MSAHNPELFEADFMEVTDADGNPDWKFVYRTLFTLRDLFAAAALAGLAANPESLAEWTPDEMIRRAFSDADAMLEERAKRGRS